MQKRMTDVLMKEKDAYHPVRYVFLYRHVRLESIAAAVASFLWVTRTRDFITHGKTKAIAIISNVSEAGRSAGRSLRHDATRHARLSRRKCA